MKNLLKISALILVLFMGGVMTGCGNNSKEINFVVGYQGGGFGEDMKCMVDTLSELDEIKPDPFIELDKYNEQFFIDNSLIVYEFTLNYGGGQKEVTNVITKGNKLIVKVILGVGGLAIMEHTIIIIEVSKADISGTNSLQIARND